jgi:hypothetical protein
MKASLGMPGCLQTSVVTEELSVATIESKQWQVVVLCDRSIKEQLAINAACHANGVKFISADIRGNLSFKSSHTYTVPL